MRLLAIVVASLLLSCIPSILGAQEHLEKLQNRAEIAKVVLSRLEQKAQEQQIQEQQAQEQQAHYKFAGRSSNEDEPIDLSKVREAYNKLLETGNEASWEKFMSCTVKMARRFSVGSLVEIKTFRNGIEKSGATIKYQLTARSEIKTAQRLSPATEFIIPIGIYYVWSERGDRITSNKNEYTLVGEKASLELNEYR